MSEQALSYIIYQISKFSYLKEIKLFDFVVSDEAVKHLAYLIKHNNSINTIYFTLQSGKMLKDLSEVLLLNRTLNYLEIAVNRDSFTRRDLKLIRKDDSQIRIILNRAKNIDFNSFLAGILKNKEEIQNLKIHNNNIDTTYVNIISGFIEENQNLVVLNLANNKLGDNSIIEMSNALTRNSFLQELNLANNNLTLVGYNSLKELLIKKIDLNYNLIEGQTMQNHIQKGHEFSVFKEIQQDEYNDTISLVQLKDGTIVSGSSENQLRVWDENLKFTQTLDAHNGRVNCLLEITNGRFLSGSYDNTIKLWKFDHNNYLMCLSTFDHHTDKINSLLLLSEGKVVSSSNDNTLKIWISQGDNFTCENTFMIDTSVLCLIQLSDGYVAAGFNDKTVRILDPKDSFKSIRTLEHKERVLSLIQLNDLTIASGCEYGEIIYWSPNDDFKSSKSIEYGEGGNIDSLILLKYGRIASCSTDGKIRLIEPYNEYAQRQKICCSDSKNYSVCSILLLNNGKIFSGLAGGKIMIWEETIFNIVQSITKNKYQ